MPTAERIGRREKLFAYQTIPSLREYLLVDPEQRCVDNYRFGQGVLTVTDESLFPRYLFIRQGQGDSAPSWASIRSTKGVSRLVSFGSEPAHVPDRLVEALCEQEASVQVEPERLFKPGPRPPDGTAVCRYRRYLSDDRWRAPRHGVN